MGSIKCFGVVFSLFPNLGHHAVLLLLAKLELSALGILILHLPVAHRNLSKRLLHLLARDIPDRAVCRSLLQPNLPDILQCSVANLACTLLGYRHPLASDADCGFNCRAVQRTCFLEHRADPFLKQWVRCLQLPIVLPDLLPHKRGHPIQQLADCSAPNVGLHLLGAGALREEEVEVVAHFGEDGGGVDVRQDALDESRKFADALDNQPEISCELLPLRLLRGLDHQL